MTTITVFPENTSATQNAFRAVAGDKQSTGPTVGQALAAQLPGNGTTLVVIQPMRGDEFFPEADRLRLGELMARWRTARDAGKALPAEEQADSMRSCPLS